MPNVTRVPSRKPEGHRKPNKKSSKIKQPNVESYKSSLKNYSQYKGLKSRFAADQSSSLEPNMNKNTFVTSQNSNKVTKYLAINITNGNHVKLHSRKSTSP